MMFPPTCNKDTPYNAADRAYPIVRCMHCAAQANGNNWDQRGKSAIEFWNKRATPDPAPAPSDDNQCNSCGGFCQGPCERENVTSGIPLALLKLKAAANDKHTPSHVVRLIEQASEALTVPAPVTVSDADVERALCECEYNRDVGGYIVDGDSMRAALEAYESARGSTYA